MGIATNGMSLEFKLQKVMDRQCSFKQFLKISVLLFNCNTHLWFLFIICDIQLEKKVCQLLIVHLEPWSAFVLKSCYTGLQHQYVVNLPHIGAIFWVAFIQKEVTLVLLMISFLEWIRHFLYLICIYPFAPLTFAFKSRS